MSDLTGLGILVLGAGVSGCAAARLAHSRGAEVTVVDSAPRERLSADALRLESEGIALRCGELPAAWDGPEVSQVVVSPGIRLDSPLHRLAESTGAAIVGELEFGASFLKCPCLAVTGTNGKTTTTELLAACLEGAGCRALASGNIGLPVSQVALENRQLDYLVVEVSSFQLEHAASFQPQVAILLNVTPDHLDRHGTLERYRSLKARLLEQVAPGGTAIYHAAVEESLRLPETVRRSRIWLAGETPNIDGRPGGKDWRVGVDGLRTVAQGEEGLSEELLMPRSMLTLQGNHNLANALAVVAAMDALGFPFEKYRMQLSNFQSGPHRIQFVAARNGVKYFDDSKATDADALVQALRTLGPSVGKTVHLIAGGLDKGCSLAEAKSEIRMYVKDAYLIGDCRLRLAQEWKDETECRIFDSLEDAVASAAQDALDGEVVLLSPGCASMDMFKSYEERGRRFAAAVSALPPVD